MPPQLARHAAAQEGIVLRRQAAAAGFDDTELARLIRGGTLHRLRRGVLVDAAIWDALDAAGRYRALVVGTLLLSGRRLVATHWSAAALLRLDLLGPWPDEIHVAVVPRNGGRSTGRLRRHAELLAEGEVINVSGLPVTSAARTAVDLARAMPFRDAVVVCDSVLRRSLASAPELDEVVTMSAGLPGAPTARRAVAFADARSGSAGESLSRVVLHELALPTPALQTAFHDARGLVGLSDYWWRAQRTIGEFDGRVKYRVPDQCSPAEAGAILWREKNREDRLRALGNEVVRWTWWHLEHPEHLNRLVREAFARGAGRR